MKKIGLIFICGLIVAWLGLPAAAYADGGVTGSFEVKGDETPPNPIIDLEVTGTGCYTINLSWTAPGDDGDIGTATEYDIRYSRSIIDSEGAWQAANKVSAPPTPQPAGSTETFTVTGLKTCTIYYFAIKAADDNSNWSGLSNSPEGKTRCCGGGGDFSPTVVAGTEPCYLIIDVLGEITRAEVLCEGEDVILLDSHTASDANDEVILQLDSGTKVILSNSQRAERLEVRLPEALPPVPESLVSVSPVYEFTAYAAQEVPQPVRFEPPIGVNIGFKTEDVPDNTGALFIAYFHDSLGWVQLNPPEGYIARVGVAAAEVTHFTPFAVLADLLPPPHPAKFELSNLSINPILAKPGQKVTISAELVNIGGLSGEHLIKVTVEDLLETGQVVNLAPEQMQEITFTVTPDNPGSYRVQMNDLKGYFVVTTILPPLEQVAYWWIIPIIVGVILATWASLEMRRREPQFATIGGKALKPTPNAFGVSNLHISQAQVKPGGSVTIFAEVTNTSSTRNRYSLVLKIQAVAEAVKEVSLRPGQVQKVAFTIIKEQPGIYDVNLEGLKGSFTVAD